MDKELFVRTLAHYTLREPKRFLQLDGNYEPNGGNAQMSPDSDGDSLEASGTVELMVGATVRVLIPYDTDPKVAVRQLKKFTKWLKRKPELLEYAGPVPEHAEELPDPFHHRDYGIPF